MVTGIFDAVERLFVTNTHDSILFFTNRGRVFQLKDCYEVSDANRQVGHTGGESRAVGTKRDGSTVLTLQGSNRWLHRNGDHRWLRSNEPRSSVQERAAPTARAITLEEPNLPGWKSRAATECDARHHEDTPFVSPRAGYGHGTRRQQASTGSSCGKMTTSSRMVPGRQESRYLLVVTEKGYGKRAHSAVQGPAARRAVSALKITAGKTGDLVAARVIGRR